MPVVETFERRRNDIQRRNINIQGIDIDITAAICFDMAFPDWIKHSAGAKLMLNPSQLWNDIGYHFLRVIAFRAIENGNTIFHCGNDGVMAVIDAHGRILNQKVHENKVNKTILFFALSFDYNSRNKLLKNTKLQRYCPLYKVQIFLYRIFIQFMQVLVTCLIT